MKRYTIKYHSTMTDITLYFIHENKGVLLDFEKDIKDYMECDQADILSHTQHLCNLGIKIYNNDVEKIPEDLIVIKEHEFRF